MTDDALKAAGDPDRIADLAQVRRQFDEAGGRAVVGFGVITRG
jgi:hypothetical protein